MAWDTIKLLLSQQENRNVKTHSQKNEQAKKKILKEKSI